MPTACRVQSSRASTATGSDGPKSLPGTAAAPERDSKWSRQVGPPWAQACAGAAGMHRALTALREQIVAAREARQVGDALHNDQMRQQQQQQLCSIHQANVC